MSGYGTILYKGITKSDKVIVYENYYEYVSYYFNHTRTVIGPVIGLWDLGNFLVVSGKQTAAIIRKSDSKGIKFLKYIVGMPIKYNDTIYILRDTIRRVMIVEHSLNNYAHDFVSLTENDFMSRLYAKGYIDDLRMVDFGIDLMANHKARGLSMHNNCSRYVDIEFMF